MPGPAKPDAESASLRAALTASSFSFSFLLRPISASASPDTWCPNYIPPGMSVFAAARENGMLGTGSVSRSRGGDIPDLINAFNQTFTPSLPTTSYFFFSQPPTRFG